MRNTLLLFFAAAILTMLTAADSAAQGEVDSIAPAVVIEPALVEFDLRSGERADTSLRIRNDGGDVLTFAMSASPAAAPSSHLSRQRVTPHLPLLRSAMPAPKVAVEARSVLAEENLLDEGGPDAFGYSWVDSDEAHAQPFAWIGADGGTVLSLQDDDFRSNVLLGFAFEFYGQQYTAIGVGSNGWLSFGSGTPWFPDVVPGRDGLGAVLAPFATDLDPSLSGTVRYRTVGEAPQRQFVVEYRDVEPYGGGPPNTFAVVLEEGSNVIRFQYLSVTVEPNALGIESPDESIGIGNGAIGDLHLPPSLIRSGYEIVFTLAPRWMLIDPLAGSIAPGEFVDVTVLVDGSRLRGGAYAADILVQSNDPLQPLVMVHVSADVESTAPLSGRIETTNLTNAFAMVRATPGNERVVVDAEGGFTFENLIPGAYEIWPERLGVTFEPTHASVTIGFEEHAELFFTATQQSSSVTEAEPNDVEGQANVIGYGDELSGSLDFADADYFLFSGQAGDSVGVLASATETSNLLEPPQLITSPRQIVPVSLDGWSFNGSGGTLVWVLPESGIYYLRIATDQLVSSAQPGTDADVVLAQESLMGQDRLRPPEGRPKAGTRLRPDASREGGSDHRIRSAGASGRVAGDVSHARTATAEGGYTLRLDRFTGLPPTLLWTAAAVHHASIRVVAPVASLNRAGTARIHYGTTSALGQASDDFTIPAGGTLTTTHLSMEQLTPGTDYYFRVVAENAAGRTEGPLQIAQTAPPPEGWMLYERSLAHSTSHVYFLDDAWGVAGGDGPLLTTSDGGRTWTEGGELGAVRDLNMVSPDTIWAMLLDGWLMRSTDGGRNWNPIVVSTAMPMRADFVDRLTGWVASYDGSIFRTTNGGESWHQVRPGSFMIIQDLDFVDRENGVVVTSDGVVMRTDDGGTSWVDRPSLSGQYVGSISFADALHGVVLASNRIFLTEDGGSNWRSVWVGQRFLNDVYLSPDGRGVAVGAEGFILRTEDGGASWQPEQGGTRVSLYGVHGSGSTTVAVGELGTLLVSDRVTLRTPPSDWTAEPGTAPGATVRIPALAEPSIGTRPLRAGDAVGAFFVGSDGPINAGFGVWTPGQDLIIPLIGDEPATAEKDGFADDDFIRFAIWNARSGEVLEAEPSWAEGNSRFSAGAQKALSSLVVGDGIIRFVVDLSLDRQLIEGGGSVGLRGDAFPLSWDESIPMHRFGESDLYIARVDLSHLPPATNVAYRYVIDRSLMEVQWEATMPDGGNRVYRYNVRSENLEPVFWSNRSVAAEEAAEIPAALELEQNYPNPFNPTTSIRFGLPERGHVDLFVYDVLGREVARLVSGEMPAGYHTVTWEAESLASGVYFYAIRAGDRLQSRKLVLLR